jgi:hypothetical protein
VSDGQTEQTEGVPSSNMRRGFETFSGPSLDFKPKEAIGAPAFDLIFASIFAG